MIFLLCNGVQIWRKEDIVKRQSSNENASPLRETCCGVEAFTVVGNFWFVITVKIKVEKHLVLR